MNKTRLSYGKAALAEIIMYFRENGADVLYLLTEPENEGGIHVYIEKRRLTKRPDACISAY